jgi:hypothetical protein
MRVSTLRLRAACVLYLCARCRRVLGCADADAWVPQSEGTCALSAGPNCRCEAHRKSCPDCRAVAAPDLSGGLRTASRIEWRLAGRLLGEVEVYLGQSIGALLQKQQLHAIKAGMSLPILWGADTVELCAHLVLDAAGQQLGEAVLSDETVHELMPLPLHAAPASNEPPPNKPPLSPAACKRSSAKGKEAACEEEEGLDGKERAVGSKGFLKTLKGPKPRVHTPMETAFLCYCVYTYIYVVCSIWYRCYSTYSAWALQTRRPRTCLLAK